MVAEKKDIVQVPFDLIWRRFPERQVKSSSVWWFFLLLPKQDCGYGPKQAMFALLSAAGDSYTLNHKKQLGLGPLPKMEGNVERFSATAQGWFFDGREMHRDIVNESCRAVLSPRGFIKAWTRKRNGQMAGGEFRSFGDKPFGILGEFAGDGGSARFEAWGSSSSNTTAPAYVYDHDGLFGGYHMVTWRRLHFAGEISHAKGAESIEGIGYFQRICLNVPLFPWKWIWATFEDESIFSCSIPYLGLQLFRRRDGFFPNRMEQATIALRSGGYFCRGDDLKTIEFNKARVTPIVGENYPRFAVECCSEEGDFIRYDAIPYSHAQMLLDRPFLGNLLHTHFNYNEYPFRIANLEGEIAGKILDRERLGNGFGNCEYTWGLGC
jgi:hypothetical protein